MKCDKTEDKLIGYLLNTLEQEERESLETHLASCQTCQRRMEVLEKTRGFLREWKAVNPPPGLKQKVLDTIRAQRLIEEKTLKESSDEAISMEKILEWLKKRVNSEQIRIYTILTDFLGKEKGEEVFDYYLEEDMKQQMSIPPQELKALIEAVSLNVEVKVLEGGAMQETVRDCAYLSMASELGMKVSPCEAICLKLFKLRETFNLKVEHIKKMPNKEGECIFLLTPLASEPFR